MTVRCIDTAEAAKLLRPLLKREFPAVKFSVRIERYAGGSSVNVFWTDGPTVERVEQVTNGFRGGRFEGMTDCTYSADSWYCPEHGARVAETHVASNNDVHASRCCTQAELVHFRAKHVFTHRAISPDFTAELRAEVIRQSGLAVESDDRTRLPEGSAFQYGLNDTVRDGIYRLSCQMVSTTAVSPQRLADGLSEGEAEARTLARALGDLDKILTHVLGCLGEAGATLREIEGLRGLTADGARSGLDVATEALRAVLWSGDPR